MVRSLAGLEGIQYS